MTLISGVSSSYNNGFQANSLNDDNSKDDSQDIQLNAFDMASDSEPVKILDNDVSDDVSDDKTELSSVQLIDIDGLNTVIHYDDDGNVKYTTEIAERSGGMFYITKKHSDGTTESSAYMKFLNTSSEFKYKFASGNSYSISIKPTENGYSATSSKGSLEAQFDISKDENGLFVFNGESYASLDEIASEINNIEIENSNDMDGVFGVSAQAFNGLDCGLLSAINSLNYSDLGREALQNAVRYDADGTAHVYLEGLNREYTFTQNDLDTIPKLPMGDDDMRLLDAACRMAGQDVLSGQISISPDAPYYCNYDSIYDGNLQSGFYPQTVYYFLTGKDASDEFKFDRFDRIMQLDAIEQGNRLALCVASGYETDGYFEYANVKRFDVYVPGKAVTDAFGNECAVPNMHSYAVKDVNTKTDGSRVVTLVNPWDSGDELVLDEQTYLDLFDVMYAMQISENDAKPRYMY